MMRDLWIPVAGTIAAVLAVAIARGTEPQPRPDGGPSWHGGAGPLELRLQLRDDGALVDLDDGTSFPSIDALLAVLPEDETERTVVALEAAAGVPIPRLHSVAAALGARCDVRIEQRDDETQSPHADRQAEEDPQGRDEEGAR